MAGELSLRDSSLCTWSSPVTSKKLWKPKATVPRAPKLHSVHDVIEQAAAADEEKRLTATCQRASGQRSEDDVLFVQSFMRQLSPFFKLWPDNLQRELCRVLTTEILVRGETVISRGTPYSKVLFVLRGKLDVIAPVNPFAKTVETRVVAQLGRGETCGEAALLGSTPSHADVVVSSRGAVLLSLSFSDFLRAFKEILGLRQQDRLLYLRLHPLFAREPLGDLDALSDALQLSFYPAGVQLAPQPRRGRHGPGESHIYLLAEGECGVRRVDKGGAGAAAAMVAQDARHSALYDADTVSVLGPLDAFGLPPHHPGCVVVTLSQVKAYHMSYEQFAALPPNIRKLVEDAHSFKGAYLQGRMDGLARLDRKRHTPQYGAITYKVGDVVMTSLNTSLAAAAGGDSAAPGGEDAAAPDAPPAAGALPGAATRMGALLLELTAQQVIRALDADAPRDRHTGLHPDQLRQHPEPLPWSHSAADGQHHHTSHHLPYPHQQHEGGDGDDASKTFITQVPGDHHHHQHDRHGHHHQQHQQHQHHYQPGGLSDHQYSSYYSSDNQSSDHHHSPGRSRPVDPALIDIGTMPPDVAAWPRVPVAKIRPAVTEPPAPQPVPFSLRQRHAAMFARAQQHQLSPRSARPDEGSDGEDDDLSSHGGGSIGDDSRQPSRRLSGNRRLQRRASGTMRVSGGGSSSGMGGEDRPASGAAASMPLEYRGHHATLTLTSSPPSGSGLAAGGGDGALALPQSRLGSAVSAASSGSQQQHHAPPLPPGRGDRSRDSSRGAAGSRGQAAGSARSASTGRGQQQQPGSPTRASSSSTSPRRGRGPNSGSEDEAQGGGQQQQPVDVPGGLNQTLRRRGSGGTQRSGSSSARADQHERQQGGVTLPPVRRGSGGSSGRSQAASQQRQRQHTPPDHAADSDALLQPGSPKQGRRKTPPGADTTASPRSAAAAAAQQQQQSAPSSAPGSGRQQLLADTMAPGASPAGAHAVAAAAAARQPQQQGGGVVLPPSVVLGYESLNPFEWAALMSHSAAASARQGSADSILPKPNW